jgi:hypothetical protein
VPTRMLLAAILLAQAALRATDAAPPSSFELLELKDGRVLHHVKVMSEEPDSIVVRADEGLVKVEKADLPKAAAEIYAVKPGPKEPELMMQRFDPNQVVEAPVQEPGAKPAPKPVPKPAKPAAPANNPVFKGCTIISFQMKAFQTVLGCAEVVIHNDTDTVVEIRPGDIVCMTIAGNRLIGRNLVTDGFPPRVKRREFIAPRGDMDDLVTFANDAIEIASVQWAR